MFGNCPRAVWEKWIAPDAKDRIPLACRCLLVQMDGKNILLETGIGNFFEPKLAERYGVQEPDRSLLLENLKDLGVSEEDIDWVVLSHLHFDHAGGLLSSWGSEPALRFPHATYVVGKTAWERALTPHFRDRASFIPELTELLKKSGRLQVIEDPQSESLFAGAITFVESNGHTPGQLHAVLKGPSGRRLVYAGDLVPGRFWVHLPITMGYDRYPELLIDEKRKLFEDLQPGDILYYTHDSEMACSEVENVDGKYRPKNPLPELRGFEL